MKQAVIYGAGNIGRGFIGQLFHASGYKTAFVDVNQEVIEHLNTIGKYPIFITDGDRYKTYTVENVRGINGHDTVAVANAIAEADIMATAVGVNVLSRIALPIAEGVKERIKRGVAEPLNIIICENMIRADHYLREQVKQYLSDSEQAYFDSHVGTVEPSIGRMVPATPVEIREKEPLAVCVEPYCTLPVDRNGFLGEIPEIVNMVPFSPFDFHICRKLYMHNMSHALVAYLGDRRGYEFIWQAVADADIRSIASMALDEISRAMSQEYNVPLQELQAFGNELLYRYENRLLGDTVARVGKDTERKLGAKDRFGGALKLCEKHGITPSAMLVGYSAGFLFAPEGDDASASIKKDAEAKGVCTTVTTRLALSLSDEALASIDRLYRLLRENSPLSAIL